MTNISVFDFNGQEVRFVEGNAVANDVAKVIGYTDPAFSSDDFYTVFDLLAIAVEVGFAGQIDKAEQVFRFIKSAGMINDATTERLYHACRIHQAWATNASSKDTNSIPEVYLVGNRKNKTLKIGFSTQVKKRIEGLQVSSPYQLELISKVQGTMALEKKLHKEFSHLRISGEWFKWSDEIIQKFKHMESLETDY
jgi:hypothetical protein